MLLGSIFTADEAVGWGISAIITDPARTIDQAVEVAEVLAGRVRPDPARSDPVWLTGARAVRCAFLDAVPDYY
jgi:hypothetical protein